MTPLIYFRNYDHKIRCNRIEMAAQPMEVVLELKATHTDNSTHDLVDVLGLAKRIRGEDVSLKRKIDLRSYSKIR